MYSILIDRSRCTWVMWAQWGKVRSGEVQLSGSDDATEELMRSSAHAGRGDRDRRSRSSATFQIKIIQTPRRSRTDTKRQSHDVTTTDSNPARGAPCDRHRRRRVA